MNFFLKKQLIKFSCTYWPLSFCKIFKKFLAPIQSYKDVPFSGPKWSICHKQIFLIQTIIITFTYLLSFFTVQNLKKFLQRIQNYENAPFWGPKWSICPPKIFFGKLLISFSSYYQPLSLCKILKKFFWRIQSYEDAQFLGPKWPISPNENFFSRKPVNEPCFFYSCLSISQKSKSDINLLVKY